MLRMVEINDIALRNAIEYFALRDVDQSGSIWADWHNLAHLEGSGIAGEVSQVRYMLITGSDGASAWTRTVSRQCRRASRASDFFDVQAAITKLRTAGPLFVGEPLLEEGGTELYLPISRRIGRPETGAFGGSGRGRDPAGNFEQVLRVAGRRPERHPVLMHANGTILSINPFRGDLFGQR